jgi:hypothetical protein
MAGPVMTMDVAEVGPVTRVECLKPVAKGLLSRLAKVSLRRLIYLRRARLFALFHGNFSRDASVSMSRVELTFSWTTDKYRI